jgi:hypothetical protein
MDSKSDGTGSSLAVSEGLTPQAALDRLLGSKQDQRRRLASLPFAEKFRLVAEMRALGDEAVRAGAIRGLCDLTVRTYTILHRSIQAVLQREANGRDVPHWMTIGVLSAFLFEAYLNHVGLGLFRSWRDLERKLGHKEKLTLICQILQIDHQRIASLGLADLFRFRDRVAHGTTETKTVVLPSLVTTTVLDEMPFNIEPLKSSNRDVVSRWASTVEEAIRFVHAAYAPEARKRGLTESDDPFELVVHGPIYMGTPEK